MSQIKIVREAQAPQPFVLLGVVARSLQVKPSFLSVAMSVEIDTRGLAERYACRT